MIISNESADRGVANLLFFKYNKKPKSWNTCLPY
jgi:hypothetical protein